MNKELLSGLAKRLAPVQTQHDLIRLGPFDDGGYLVPNDLQGVTACFSPGVASSAYFENDALRVFGIPSHLADYSVDGAPHGFPAASFSKKYVGVKNDDVYMTMEKWVTDVAGNDTGDFLLQMDIEGDEFYTLAETPDEILNRFRIMVVEVHWLDQWMQREHYEKAERFISKLEKNFVVVHNHPNNWGGLVNLDGLICPKTIEVTFLRKDRCQVLGPVTTFPHKLDRPCKHDSPDLLLPEAFRG